MARCNGKGFPECESCINAEFDPFECEKCEGGSNWEGESDDADALTVHDLKHVVFRKAA